MGRGTDFGCRAPDFGGGAAFALRKRGFTPGDPVRGMRSVFRSTLLSLLVLLALAACTDGSGSDASADGTVRLVYWSSQNPQERELAEKLTAQWNAENPGVQVTVQPLPAGQSSEEVLLAAIVAGTTPDVCSNIWPGIMSDFERAGGVLALDTLPGFDAFLDARVPDELQARFRSHDGHYYQIPWKTNPIMMVYNVDLLREAGYDTPPRTYSEYLDAAARVTKDTDGDGQIDRWMGARDIRPIWWQRYFDFYPLYVAASGGKTLFQDGEVALDARAANDVFGLFQTLYARGYYPLSTLQGNAFAAGRIATEFTGPWSAAWLRDNGPEGLEYDYAPVPVPDDHTGPVVTYGDYKNIALFSTTRHPAEAWAFAQFLVSEDADRMLVEMTSQIPLRKGLLEDPQLAAFFEANPAVRRFAQQAPHTRGVDSVTNLQEILDAVAQSFERAVYRASTPADATERAANRIRLIHDWRKG